MAKRNKIVNSLYLKRCVEPQKRLCAGKFGWVIHRFPIKGGVTVAVIWAESLNAAASRRGFFNEHMLGGKK